MGDMRGYFHRLGYWEFIIRLILLRFSFVFYINLSWVSDSGHYLTTGFSRLYTFNLMVRRVASAYLLSEPTIFLGKCLYQVRNVLFFSCSVDWKLRWLSFLSVLSGFVDFSLWMCLGVRYHCHYLYSVVSLTHFSTSTFFSDISGRNGTKPVINVGRKVINIISDFPSTKIVFFLFRSEIQDGHHFRTKFIIMF